MVHVDQTPAWVNHTPLGFFALAIWQLEAMEAWPR